MTSVGKYTMIIILLLTVFGGFLRFYNLNWGAPYYFHPDERNIVNSVIQLHFPNQMNPNFFAYGSLPIYVIYFTGLLLNIKFPISNFQINPVSFDQAILISRFYSALLSTVLIPLLYLLGKRIHSQSVGLLASFFAMTSVGFLQFAHFGTFEMWLTFFSVLLCLLCVQITQNPSNKYLILTGIVTGILIAIKISSAALFILPILIILLTLIRKQRIQHTSMVSNSIQLIKSILFVAIPAIAIFTYTNPYILLRYDSFRSAIEYESRVALGTTPVFYTQEFYATTPVMFQFLHVYPFLINPLLTLLFVLSVLYVLWQSYKTKNKSYFILYISYFILFLSQAFLFVKWTRYMVPTLPFIYLIISITLIDIPKIFKKQFLLFAFYFLLFTTCVLFSFSYYHTVLAQPDSRLAAKKWARAFLPSDKGVLTEGYDLGTLPFATVFQTMSSCDMYIMETNPYPCNGRSVTALLGQSTYILLPSQRVLQSRVRDKLRYPKGHAFYQALLQGKLGYQIVYQTPCSIFCTILYLGDPLYSFEQTANVFDRPPVFILKNVRQNSNQKMR